MIEAVSEGTYHVPVAERTPLERSTLRRFHRYKEFYSIENNRLYYKGKELLCESKCRKVITHNYHKSKGIGVRRLYHVLKRRYTGVSEAYIKQVISKLPDYQKRNAKFSNKAPLKHVCSSSVHDILQIDLVDMQRHAVIYDKEKCKFILSVMDIFSRFVWLRAIPSKSADVITKHLSRIFAEFGKPKIIQHDRGREFDGEVKRLLKVLNIKNIKSRPYHPQSQGKVERMHKTLKQKIAYDLTHANSFGINWAKQLPEYQRILNNDPKECLAWKSPHEVYYGRDPYNDNSKLNRKLLIKKLRDAAKVATLQCNRRNDRAQEKANKTPIYNIGDSVLLRYKKKGLINRRIWAVDGVIQKRSMKTNMYKIKYRVPESARAGQSARSEEKWYHVSNLTQYTCTSTGASNKKRLHRKQYCIATTKSSQLENLRSEFGLPVVMDPIGNGNCQFAAVSYHLRQYGIHRSEETLRQEVVTFLRQTPVLGNRICGANWWNSILEQPRNYLSRMSTEKEYGDQLTLQAMSQLYNMQILIVSTRNSATTLISPDGSSCLSSRYPLIILGHYPEGAGEHYVALGYKRHVLERIVDTSAQVTWETDPPTSDDDLNVGGDDLSAGGDDLSAGGDDLNAGGDDLNAGGDDLSAGGDDLNAGNYDLSAGGDDLNADGDDLNAGDLGSPNTSDITRLREMVQFKRNRKHVQQNRHVILPREIWSIIVDIVLKLSPLSRYSLQRVNRMFRDLVGKTPPPRLYLCPSRFGDVTVSPISVRKIIALSGSGSGLVQAIRQLIRHSSWVNAWLFLRLATLCGWYTVKGIWYRRQRRN